MHRTKMMKVFLVICIVLFSIASPCFGKVGSHGNLGQYKENNSTWLRVLTKVKEKAKSSAIETDHEASQDVADTVSWKDCGSGYNELAEVLSVVFNPNPPQKGVFLNIATKIQLFKEVNGGNVFVSLKYLGYISVLKETLDLCELVTESGDSCPLGMGVHESNIGGTFPSFAFSGLYSGTVKAVNDENNELSCVKVEFTL